MTSASSPAHDGAPTVNDVAALASVSRQTVSNVLNAPEKVRAATRERVEAAIASLGYRPHRLARNLKARTSRLLGYAVPESPGHAINPLLDRFLHDLTAAARDAGYLLLLFTPHDGQDAVAAHLDLSATRTVDGFVLAETNYGDARVSALAERGVPFVAFGRTGVDAPHAWVDVDGATGTAAAVAHLAARGHRRIAFVGWPSGSISGDDRLAGYHGGLREGGVTPDPALEEHVENGTGTGAQAARRLLAADPRPTAIITVSDLLAVGVMTAARELGLTVGGDLAVTGFDDTPLAAFLDPPLTSVRQPLEEVGRVVVRLLTARLAGEETWPEHVLLTPQLIVRDTS